MADDGSKQSQNVWPLAKFSFSVDFGDGVIVPFQEISGLNVETQPIEFRGGDSKVFSTAKMPGIKKLSDVTMKKGIFRDDKTFWDWVKDIKVNTVKRRDVVISLLDEKGAPTMVWTLTNAWPVKITGTDMKSDGNEVAIETIVLAHEGLKVANV